MSFLIGSMSSLGTAWLATHWPAIVAAREYAQYMVEAGQPAFHFFDPHQAAEIEAVAAQIIPADDTPGAREAGVIYFINRALTTFERDKQAIDTQGLPEIQAKTRQLFPDAHKFSDLSSVRQVQLLTWRERRAMTRIILIGAGKGGKALVELFHKDPTIEIAGVADKDAGAPGLVLARELGLRVSADYREFLTVEEDGLIIDGTGNPDVGREIYELQNRRLP